MGKIVRLDEALVNEASEVLDKIGMDVETVIRMTLKRVVRDNGISFLVADLPAKREPLQVQQHSNEGSGRVNKHGAIARLRNEGYEIGGNVTFASKNRGANHYWANPTFDVLKRDWYLILHDWRKNELHLFKIPANTLTSMDFVCRNDRTDRIDLQICYEDPRFTDNRSKVSFLKFHLGSICY